MDWLKVEKATVTKREVIVIAGMLEVTPEHAFGLCFKFWVWCDDNMVDGNAPGVTPSLLDSLLGRYGFADSLISVGWLRVRNGSLEVPNFDRHLSKSAKNRALTAQRVSKSKSKSNAKGNAKVTVEALPDKRRLDKSIKEIGGGPQNEFAGTAIDPTKWNLPERFRTPELLAALTGWQQHQRAIGKPFAEINAFQLCQTYAQWGPEKLAKAINLAITNSWATVHDPDNEPPKQQGRKQQSNAVEGLDL